MNSSYKSLTLFEMPSTTSNKKAKARRLREANIMSDIETMDVMLGSGEYNQIERGINKLTGFSNMLDRDENGDNNSMRVNSSQENEIRNIAKNLMEPVGESPYNITPQLLISGKQLPRNASAIQSWVSTIKG